MRRRFIAEKYADLIDALYSDQDSVNVNATFTYEDGRTKTMNATLGIRDAQSY